MRKPQLLAAAACVCLAVVAAAQTTDAPKRLRISSRVADGLKTHSVDPTYPREARDKGIQGDVILQATIDTKGNIASLKAVKGDPILADASIEAVKQWKYKPFLLNGEPVEVETTILIKFHL
jgi:periplasmic protein TonB